MRDGVDERRAIKKAARDSETARQLVKSLDNDDPAEMAAQASSQMESYDKKMAAVAAPLLSAAQLKAFTIFQSQQRESLLAHVRMSMLNMQQRKSARPAKPAQ